MDNKRLQQLAGIKPLHETYVGSEHEESITYNGFRLEQEKEYEDDRWHIMHDVYKNNKYLAGLDHSPREWIDEKTFHKYVDFYQKYGRFPNRDDFRAGQQPTGPMTNQQILTLKEAAGDYDQYSSHYEEEKMWFGNAIKDLQQIRRFVEREDAVEQREYSDIYKTAGQLIGKLQNHLRKYE